MLHRNTKLSLDAVILIRPAVVRPWQSSE